MTTQTANTVSTIELENVYIDNIERKLRNAVANAETQHQQQLSELSYLAYEAISRGKFGKGRFTVAITCGEDEFIVAIKGG